MAKNLHSFPDYFSQDPGNPEWENSPTAEYEVFFDFKEAGTKPEAIKDKRFAARYAKWLADGAPEDEAFDEWLKRNPKKYKGL